MGVDVALDPALAGAWGSIGGLSSSLSHTTVFGFNERARFSNGDFSGIEVALAGGDCGLLGCTFAGNFSVYGPAGSGTPTTFADVEALLNDPTSTVRFSFNGTAAGEFVGFAAESSPATPIPLPAGGVLLLTALGAGAALRRRD